VGRAINPRIQISRKDKQLLVDAGYPSVTVRTWFFKTSGPSLAQLPGIEEVLGRDLEIIDRELLLEKAPEPDPSHGMGPEGSGFCWVPFSAWEGLKKKDVCELCVKKNAVCRKADQKAEAAV
jgi:hypothetical protein